MHKIYIYCTYTQRVYIVYLYKNHSIFPSFLHIHLGSRDMTEQQNVFVSVRPLQYEMRDITKPKELNNKTNAKTQNMP